MHAYTRPPHHNLYINPDPSLIYKRMEYENRCRSPDSTVSEVYAQCPKAGELLRSCIPNLDQKFLSKQIEKIPEGGRSFARFMIAPTDKFLKHLKHSDDVYNKRVSVQIALYSVFPSNKATVLGGLCTLPTKYHSTCVTTNLRSWVFVVLHAENKTSLLATCPIRTTEPSIYKVYLYVSRSTNLIGVRAIVRTKDPRYEN